MTPNDYTAIRCGMNVSKAIINGDIDAGIGLENVQMVELEEWLSSQGRPTDDVQMLRIDELAELGCCCFCSILYIGLLPLNPPVANISTVLTNLSVCSQRAVHCRQPREGQGLHEGLQEGHRLCPRRTREGLRRVRRHEAHHGHRSQPQDLRAFIRLLLPGPPERQA
jgi:hypothetical protein